MLHVNKYIVSKSVQMVTLEYMLEVMAVLRVDAYKNTNNLTNYTNNNTYSQEALYIFLAMYCEYLYHYMYDVFMRLIVYKHILEKNPIYKSMPYTRTL